jgi:hypothetical protein
MQTKVYKNFLLILIENEHSLQRLMKNRSAFNTNLISAIHNFILTIWSLIMSLGTAYFAFLRAYVSRSF